VTHSQRRPRVAVIGAGFAGIGMAAGLLRDGIAVTVLERAADVGGVWRDNTYPGAACDVPSSLYSYSFAPNPAWPRRYARQPDIHAYLRRVAADTGVLDHVRLSADVVGAAFDEAARRWRIDLAGGEVVEADVLVSAVGQLSRPVVPDLPGADVFAGPAFHSARWEHGHDLRGRRIAVIGTGASAVQFVPHLQRLAARLTVFQRTPPHVVPKPDRSYRPWHHRLFRAVPLAQRVGRLGTWLVGEALTSALTSAQPLGVLVDGLFRLHLRRQVPDAALRSRLVPAHRVGCRRLLFSNDWFPALARPNVEVVTEKITELTPTGVRTADGVDHPADVVVYATGFAATDFLAPLRIRGRGGRDLAREWADGARAHLGITVPGFPNLFLLYGPNTNLGGNSVVCMIERQCDYVRQLVGSLVRTGLSTVEVRREVADRFDAETQERLARTVWTRCASWYRDAAGRVVTNWPGSVREYRRRTRRVDHRDFHHGDFHHGETA
jgi:cation diffusion facilitator CzcD-associated flavoprotein CzcO